MKQEGIGTVTKVALGVGAFALGGLALFVSFGTPGTTTSTVGDSGRAADALSTRDAPSPLDGSRADAAPSASAKTVVLDTLGPTRKQLVLLGNRSAQVMSMGLTPKLAKPVADGPQSATAKKAWEANHCLSTLPTACLAGNRNAYVAAFGQCAAQILTASLEGAMVYDALIHQRIKGVHEQSPEKGPTYEAAARAKNKHVACYVDVALLLGDLSASSASYTYVRDRAAEIASLRAEYPFESTSKWGVVGHEFSSVRAMVSEVRPPGSLKDAYLTLFKKLSEGTNDCSATQLARDPACKGGGRGYLALGPAKPSAASDGGAPKDTIKAVDMDRPQQSTPPPSSGGSEARCLIADVAEAAAAANEARLTCRVAGRALPDNPLDRASSPRAGILDRLCKGDQNKDPKDEAPPAGVLDRMREQQKKLDDAWRAFVKSGQDRFQGLVDSLKGTNDGSSAVTRTNLTASGLTAEGGSKELTEDGSRGGLCSSAAERARVSGLECVLAVSGAPAPSGGPTATNPQGGWTDPLDPSDGVTGTCAGLLVSSGLNVGCDAMLDENCGPGTGQSRPFAGGGWLTAAMAHFGFSWAKDPSPESPCGGVPCSGGRPGAPGTVGGAPPGSPPVTIGSLKLYSLPTALSGLPPVTRDSLSVIQYFAPNRP